MQPARSVPGVVAASANLASRELTIETLSDTDRALVEALSSTGFDAQPAKGTDPAGAIPHDEITSARIRAIIAAALTLPVFVSEMGAHLIPAFHHWQMAVFGQGAVWGMQALLTTLVMFCPGRVFYRRGIPALLRGAPDMNALVALGTLAAWMYSLTVLLAPSLLPEAARFVYFEAAAVIVTLILTGRWIEARAKGATGAAIRALMALQPQTVHHSDGREIPLSDVRVGDTLIARPGDGFAVDGVVTSGTGFVDEAMITGEPNAVPKTVGDPVTSGTLNGATALGYRATATGSDTVLSQIVAMVAVAQSARLPVQDLVNRIAAWFVPAVLSIAAVTVVAWLAFGPDPALAQALVAGVSVLIIACPCAMGLAIPTSIVVGSGRAAELGVLFRQGDALQRLTEMRAIAFDKTGTLTEGRPVMTDFQTFGMDRDDAFALVAAAETGSEHPVARAVLDAAKSRDLPSTEAVRALPGQGVEATVNGATVRVGTPEAMTAASIDISVAQDAIAQITNQNAAPILAARDGIVFAAFSVRDRARDEARATIHALKGKGLHVAMLTGDTVEVATALGQDLGISDIRAGLRPEDKRTALKDIAQNHGPVAFVGDGINDAPALATADVGLAVGTGSNVAIESADVVLRSADLSGVTAAFEISQRTLTNIHQNLVWAFGYNIALIPVAAGALVVFGGPMLSPMLAAGAMALSSVLVLANALRLNWVVPRGEE